MINMLRAITVLLLCIAPAYLGQPHTLVQAASAVATVTSGAGPVGTTTTTTRIRNGNFVEGISDAVAKSSRKLVGAGTDNLLTGSDGFARIYKDAFGRPATTTGVAFQNVATSLSNANKLLSDGFRSSIDDTVSRPLASIYGTAENLFASSGASSGAFFDNAFTKPFTLLGAATRDLLGSTFPSGESETITTTAGGSSGAVAASTSGSSSSSATTTVEGAPIGIPGIASAFGLNGR